jgi:hypothetical protein
MIGVMPTSGGSDVIYEYVV